MSQRTSQEILHSAKDALKSAELGLDDVLKGDPDRLTSGLRNVVVFGRSVTNILQNLRSAELSFDYWYDKYKQEMLNDELMKYVYDLRSKILKEGLLQTSTSMRIHYFNSDDINRFPRPPNAKNFFMGDSLGGSGWEVVMPDGSIEKYYVNLPKDIGTVQVNFQDAPKSHRGKAVSDRSVQSICSMYVSYLREMVSDAYRTFGRKYR